MTFKVGDKFKVLNDAKGSNQRSGYVGLTGEVLEHKGGNKYKIKLSNGTIHSEWSDENDMEKISNMNQVKAMFKRLTDAGAQTLYKAGYINGDLELTDKGTRALNAITFDANKPALVAEAQAELDAEAAEAKK